MHCSPSHTARRRTLVTVTHCSPSHTARCHVLLCSSCSAFEKTFKVGAQDYLVQVVDTAGQVRGGEGRGGVGREVDSDAVMVLVYFSSTPNPILLG